MFNVHLVLLLVYAAGRVMARHEKEFSEPHQVRFSKVAACSLLHIEHLLLALYDVQCTALSKKINIYGT